MSFLVEQASV